MREKMFRTRFKKQILAEFLPPARDGKTQKLIILCDGMPSIPCKQHQSEFLAAECFWVIYPRYRGGMGKRRAFSGEIAMRPSSTSLTTVRHQAGIAPIVFLFPGLARTDLGWMLPDSSLGP